MKRTQLSVRRWMLCILIVGVVCALWSWHMQVAARREEAIAEITRLGGSVRRADDRGPMSFLPTQVAAVDLSHCNLAVCEDLRRVFAALSGIEGLDLSASDVTDEMLTDIAGSCPRVRTLNLSRTAVTDDGVWQLKRLSALAQLDVSRTSVDGAAFGQSDAFNQLKVLQAFGIPLSETGAGAIGQLRRLQTLGLAATDLTEDKVRLIARSSTLQDLDLSLCPINTEIINNLVSLRTLQRLQLAQGDSGVHRVEAWCAPRIDEQFLTDLDRPSATAKPPRPSFSIQPLARLPRLEYLDLTCANVAWNDQAATFGKLKDLRIAASGIQDHNAACLASFPCLERLDASDTELSADGLRWLECPRLKELILERTKVDDVAARVIARFKGLETVAVDDTKLGNVGATVLLGLPRLEVLTMAGTAVDDAIVEQLKAKATIRTLDLTDTRMTIVGVSDLATNRSDVTLWK